MADSFGCLCELEAIEGDRRVKLWTRDDRTGFYFPKEDDHILNDLGLLKLSATDRPAAISIARAIVRPYARAIGRLIFYVIANCVEKDGEYQKNDQNLHINEHVFPEIYLYYLFANISPTSSNYPMGDLVHFVSKHRCIVAASDSKKGEDDDLERVKKGLRQFIATVDETFKTEENHDLPDTIHHLREGLCKAAEQHYIKERELVLSAVKEGMSLDASLNSTFRCFRLSICDFCVDEVILIFCLCLPATDLNSQLPVKGAPLEVIRFMFLSKPTCEIQDVIDCFDPVYTKVRPDHAKYREYQEQLLYVTIDGERAGLLPDVLKEMFITDPSVAGTFMEFATGARHIPNDKCRIKIEFSFDPPNGGECTDDMLPWVHTCPKDVIFPGFAYYGNAQVLREKLSKALEYSNIFDME